MRILCLWTNSKFFCAIFCFTIALNFVLWKHRRGERNLLPKIFDWLFHYVHNFVCLTHITSWRWRGKKWQQLLLPSMFNIRFERNSIKLKLDVFERIIDRISKIFTAWLCCIYFCILPPIQIAGCEWMLSDVFKALEFMPLNRIMSTVVYSEKKQK